MCTFDSNWQQISYAAPTVCKNCHRKWERIIADLSSFLLNLNLQLWQDRSCDFCDSFNSVSSSLTYSAGDKSLILFMHDLLSLFVKSPIHVMTLK